MPTRGRPVRPAVRPSRAANRVDGWRKHADKAWLATQELTKMLPVFTSFARNISGDKSVRVAIGSQSATDGRTIWVVPPIELGTMRVHDKNLCNKRGEDSILLCPACDARETVLFPLYHEIGHIAFKSTVRIEEFYRKSLISVIDEWHPADACAHGLLLKDQVKHSDSGMALAGLFDPYLLMILNSLEDARVNSSMFRVRRGLSVMFDTQIAKLFEKGVPIPHSGEIRKWSDADINAQVVIGLFLIASGYTVGEGYLTEDAVEVLDDSELRSICDNVQMARNVQQIFEYTIQAWRRLQKLGVCFKDKCVPTPEAEEGGDGDGSPSLGNDGKPGGDSSGGADGSGDTGSPSSGSASGVPGRNDSAGPEDLGSDGSVPPGNVEDGPKSDGKDGGGSTEANPTDPESDDADVPGGGDDGDADDSTGSARSDGEPPSGSDDGGEPDEGKDPESGDSSESSGSSGGDPEESDPDRTGSGPAEDASMDEGGGDTDDSDEGEGSASPGEDESEPEEDGDDSEDGSSGRGLGGDSSGDDDGGEPDWGDWDEESESELEGDSEFGMGDEIARRIALSREGDPDLLGKFINIFNGHDIDSTLEEFSMGHGDFDPSHGTLNDADVEKALVIATIQAEYFSRSSKNISGVEVFRPPFIGREPFVGGGYWSVPVDQLKVDQAIINTATMRARLVFDENARGKEDRSLKSGRVDARVLGRRAGLGDERLFKKKTRPGKRDYFVLIGIDCSGSTASRDRINRMKRAVYAKAEMLHRLGIKFAIYGHTGNYASKAFASENPEFSSIGGEMNLWMLEIKSATGQWDNKAKEALASLCPIAANLDGHTLEFYRKRVAEVRATDKIIMYYTDGAMPLENYDEERAILIEEIEQCRRDKVTLLGVGIDTDSPNQYGLNTCIVRSDADLPNVVEHLKAQLVR